MAEPLRRVTVWDPGMTTGLVYALVRPDEPVEVVDKFEIPGGLEGVCELIANGYTPDIIAGEVWVAEKFRMTPRVRTAVQVEPLRIEGALMLANPDIIWQYPDSMLLAGGHHGSPSRNKTAADNVLRAMGLWTLPSEVDNHPDSNDINSAMKHLIAYLRRIGHKPTLEALGVA